MKYVGKLKKDSKKIQELDIIKNVQKLSYYKLQGSRYGNKICDKERTVWIPFVNSDVFVFESSNFYQSSKFPSFPVIRESFAIIVR